MPTYIQALPGLRVQKDKAATLPTPSAKADGVAIDDPNKSWSPRTGAGYPKAAIGIFADGAGSLSAGARLLAFGPYGDGGANQWMVVAPLNNGAAITLTATVGYIQEVDLPSVFTALAIDGTVNGGINVGYTATPIAVHE